MAETGHAKQVATFEVLISYVTGYGGVYKPVNAACELVDFNAASSVNRRAFQHR